MDVVTIVVVVVCLWLLWSLRLCGGGGDRYRGCQGCCMAVVEQRERQEVRAERQEQR